MEDIRSFVEDFFNNCCTESGYDSYEDYVENMKAAAEYENDRMVDACEDWIGGDVANVEDYRYEIENILAELASDEI